MMEKQALYEARNGASEEADLPSIPTSIAIGGHQWQVTPHPHLLQDDNSYGQSLEGRLVIEVEPSLPATKLQVTVLHEVLHAIELTYLSPKSRSKEENIKTLADGLFEVLTRNPSLTAFILGQHQEVQT